MQTSYLEAREMKAAKILDYLHYKLDLSYLKNEGFKHALISGYEYVYVGELNGDPYVEILNPLYVFYHKSPETMYVQDSQYAGYRTRMTVSEILDRFGEYLTSADKDKLEQDYLDTARAVPTISELAQNNSSYGNSLYNPGSHQTRNNFSYTWDIYHVEWRSYKRIGFLSYYNEYGDEVEELVSEDFVIPSSRTTKTVTKEYGKKCKYFYWTEDNVEYSLYWDYIPEIWTGVRIGSDMYCMIGPRKRQYRSSDTPQDIQLSYFGIAYSSMNADPISLMDRMKPFQYLYFIVMHKLKKLIATDVGTIYNLDRSMIDPQMGLEKTLYYLKELNLNIFNSLQNADQPGFAQRSTAHSSTSWSNMKDILNYVQLLAAIDQQISDVSGVTKQKEGLLLPNERVTNAQTAIQMSSLITGIFFTVHDNLWQKILTHLVNVATDCYRDKKMVKQYVLDDMTLSTLELSEPDLQDAEFGVFISNSTKDNQLFESLRSTAPDLIRAGKASFSDMISLYDSKSVEELRNKIKVAEEISLQTQQEQMQAQLQNNMEVEALKQEREDARKQLEVEGRIKVAEIQSFSRQMDQDINDNNVPDQLEIEKLRQNVRLKERELDIREKEVKIKEKASNVKASTKPK